MTPELGADSDHALAVPLLGNRVDRFVWNDATKTLAFDINLIMLRSFQNDASTSPTGPNGEIQPPRGNHDGGVIRFGPDGKLYVQFGDVGRRGQLQNLPSGPTLTGLGDIVPDDQFGGPRPDDAHFTGVIIRLNDDGTTPTDNPFFSAGAAMGGEEGENIQKIFAYGVRNGFGMAFDPLSGNLWDQENGEDAFDEINLVERGMNSGWIQIMGPASRGRPVQADRDDVPPSRGLPEPPAVPVGAGADRRHAGRGALETLCAAGLSLLRSGVLLEIRSGSRGNRISQ